MSAHTKMLYFKGHWPEDEVPSDSPVWMYYEVEAAEDNVMRAVEIFADGRSERNSLALEARDGFPCISIVHGPFLEQVEDCGLGPASAEEFERVWQSSTDKPFPDLTYNQF